MSEITRERVVSAMQEAADRMGLDLEDLQEMINDVLDDCSRKAKLLKEAIESSNFPTIKAIAHDIKGSTANYGLKSISEIAFQIEANSENASLDKIDRLIGQLEALSKLGLDHS